MLTTFQKYLFALLNFKFFCMFGTTLGAKLYNYYLVDDKWRLGTKNT